MKRSSKKNKDSENIIKQEDDKKEKENESILINSNRTVPEKK